MQPTNTYYITNAGLILAWPFLAHLFDFSGLVKEGKFTDTPAQHRAAELLHYMVHAEMPATDNGMELNKMLCGLTPSNAIELTHQPGEIWEELRESMWQAIISNWQVVGNTSVAGLIETFIVRNGKLQEAEDHWQLTIENKTVDILLDQLPWSISAIKLPWMLQPVYAHWR